MVDRENERNMQQGEALRNAFDQYQIGVEEQEHFAELTRDVRRCLEEQADIERVYEQTLAVTALRRRLNRERMADTFRYYRQRFLKSCRKLAYPLFIILLAMIETRWCYPSKRGYNDQTVRAYLTERTCWWNEICKEEFQAQFRCKCPLWSYCRSPGRYYNAYCTMTSTGYIWLQPEKGWRA